MLRSFHYIDEKGKDEGVNGMFPRNIYFLQFMDTLVVRNRARELVEMLSDVEKIRTERRKAKANKSKYIGVGNDGGWGSGGSPFNTGGGRYGGFGSDSLGGGAGSSYGNGERSNYSNIFLTNIFF
jgi:epsin